MSVSIRNYIVCERTNDGRSLTLRLLDERGRVEAGGHAYNRGAQDQQRREGVGGKDHAAFRSGDDWPFHRLYLKAAPFRFPSENLVPASLK